MAGGGVRTMKFKSAVSAAAICFALVQAGASATTWQAGDLTTYSEANWGGDPVGSPPSTPPDPGAALLVAQFDTVYAATFGVTVGSFSGFTMSFDNAQSVLAYMPSIGPFAALDGNILNPISTASGGFGGETLALQFNVDFSDAGKLPGTSGLRFGDLILANFTLLPQLNGLTVRQYLADLNILLSGGSSILTIADLDAALPGNFNGAFFDGQPSQFAQDHLIAPASSGETPLPPALALFATSLGVLGLLLSKRTRKAATLAG